MTSPSSLICPKCGSRELNPDRKDPYVIQCDNCGWFRSADRLKVGAAPHA